MLAAAINAGFRESGVQSLKNLDDANSFPMVAIRSSGLAMESIVGYCMDGEKEANKTGNVHRVYPLVDEKYLEMMIRLADQRFRTNAERTNRFEEDLFYRGTALAEWEDAASRQERKRSEGLKRQEALRMMKSLS